MRYKIRRGMTELFEEMIFVWLFVLRAVIVITLPIALIIGLIVGGQLLVQAIK